MPRFTIATLAASAVLATGGANAHSIEECNSTDFMTVLNAAPGKSDARGVWLDDKTGKIELLDYLSGFLKEATGEEIRIA